MAEDRVFQQRLIETIGAAADEPGREWLNQSLAGIRSSADPENDLLTLSGIARRKLGGEPLGPVAVIETPGGPLDLAGWTLGDAGRIALLLEACALDQGSAGSRISSLYRHGDERERSAIVRALVLLPGPESLKPIALEAGRTNSLSLYSALALRNPYPAAYYEDHEFNQVVLKSLFTGLDIELVVGLERRANSELSQMCEDYADERMAANRTVPGDIWLAVWPHASAHGEDLMLRFLGHEEPRHRYYAARALSRRLDANPGLSDALGKRLPVETDPMVREVITASLSG